VNQGHAQLTLRPDFSRRTLAGSHRVEEELMKKVRRAALSPLIYG
jgi:hypothetical protein